MRQARPTWRRLSVQQHSGLRSRMPLCHRRRRCEQIELADRTKVEGVEARRARLAIRLSGEEHVRDEKSLLAVYREGIDSLQRRQPGKAAARADEPLSAGDDGGLNGEVRLW